MDPRQTKNGPKRKTYFKILSLARHQKYDFFFTILHWGLGKAETLVSKAYYILFSST